MLTSRLTIDSGFGNVLRELFDAIFHAWSLYWAFTSLFLFDSSAQLVQLVLSQVFIELFDGNLL